MGLIDETYEDMTNKRRRPLLRNFGFTKSFHDKILFIVIFTSIINEYENVVYF